MASGPRDEVQRTPDAKGLSEVQRWEYERQPYPHDGWAMFKRDYGMYVLHTDYAALAERLKAVEATVDKLRGRRLNLIEYLRELEQERDQLTADLAAARAEVERLKQRGGYGSEQQE